MQVDDRLRRTVGDRMEDLRASAKLSQVTVAQRVGVTQASISNYENGKRDLPFVLALRLARVYGVEVTRLATVSDL